MNAIDKLTELFIKFPGTGRRQARRFVYFLLKQNTSFVRELSISIQDIQKHIGQCKSCYRFFKKEGIIKLCDVCANQETDTSTLLVVEKDVDYENIRKSGIYKGRFFILGDSLPILEQNPAQRIRINELLNTIKELESKGLREIILAFSVNPEGENTTEYVAKILEPIKEKHNITVARLGRGLSTGTELEYSDPETLVHAFKNRK